VPQGKTKKKRGLAPLEKSRRKRLKSRHGARRSLTGLVIGKFAPLHKGHEFLIRRALGETDEVYVLLYRAPGFLITMDRRARWIRHLFPRVHVVKGRGSPRHGKGAHIRRLHERYLARVCGRLGVTHVYSSEEYGEHAAEILGAKHVMVDKRRLKVPISATVIRKHPERFKKYLSPIVAKDFGGK
jgi:HTH-type transcriptional repressor of NAD biosynthesis genes